MEDAMRGFENRSDALLQILFSIRSNRQLVEQLIYNILFRWFLGVTCKNDLGIDKICKNWFFIGLLNGIIFG